MSANIQIIEKEGNAEYAVVPIEEWRRICALAEDAEDIQAADHAVRELAEGYDEAVPVEVVRELLEQEHPLSVWRRFRVFSQKQLADAAGVSTSYISQIESGRKAGSVQCLRRIADCLDVDIDDLVGRGEPD
jgi:DNA-binding XRE family transcriptional regulator